MMRATLAHALRNTFATTATISELAHAAHMTVDETVVELSELFDEGSLAIEASDGELFILPHPAGRDGLSVQMPENLWEQLRRGRSVSAAAALWRLTRNLERSGWRVIPEPGRWNHHLSTSGVAVDLGVVAGSSVIPFIADAQENAISAVDGVLGQLYRAGVPAVAVACPQHKLDAYVTAARRWFLQQPAARELSVLIVEAPRFQPVIVRHGDLAVDAVSVGAHTIENITW